MQYTTLESEMPFGKYRGQTIKEIADVDAPYLLWAAEKLHQPLDQEAMQYIRDARPVLHCEDDVPFGKYKI